jgi:G patch domain-containing protein 1
MGREEDEEDIYAVGLLFAPKDVESIDFSSKDNLHGIGYSGINPKTALLNQRDWLSMDPGTSKIGIKGQVENTLMHFLHK